MSEKTADIPKLPAPDRSGWEHAARAETIELIVVSWLQSLAKLCLLKRFKSQGLTF